MNTKDVNNSLVGKRVKGKFTDITYEGTIIGTVESRDPILGQVCTKGLKIRLDHPIQWGDDEYEVIESTARVKDDWGNLQHTELIHPQTIKQKYRVTFYRKVSHGMDEPTLNKVSFVCHVSSMHEAYDEAARRGHNPFKRIQIESI